MVTSRHTEVTAQTGMESRQAVTTCHSPVINRLPMLNPGTITLLDHQEDTHPARRHQWEAIRLITRTLPICHRGLLGHWEEGDREIISEILSLTVAAGLEGG